MSGQVVRKIMRVCAVTVSWNCKAYIIELLQSINDLNDLRLVKVYLVDNNSSDGTVDEVSRLFPQVEIIPLKENVGGSGGFAVGIRSARQAHPDAIWLIDGDAKVSSGALDGMINVMESSMLIGVVGSQIVNKLNTKIIQEMGALIDPVSGVTRLLHANCPVDKNIASEFVDYVPACSMLVHVQVIDKCGPIRSDLFVFYDDIEWCCRIRAGGYKIATAPTSLVYHPPNAEKPPAPWRIYYMLRNRIIWHKSVMGSVTGWLCMAKLLLYTNIRCARLMRMGKKSIAFATQQALHDGTRQILGRVNGKIEFSDDFPLGWERVDMNVISSLKDILVISPQNSAEANILIERISAMAPKGRVVFAMPEYVKTRDLPYAWEEIRLPNERSKQMDVLRNFISQDMQLIAVERNLPLPHGTYLYSFHENKLWSPPASCPFQAWSMCQEQMMNLGAFFKTVIDFMYILVFRSKLLMKYHDGSQL